jgi:lysophospholipase L1-like esterase
MCYTDDNCILNKFLFRIIDGYLYKICIVKENFLMDKLKKWRCKKISLKISFAFSYTISYGMFMIVLLSLLMGAYILWEIYWYLHVGLSFIRWHTHLMPYILIGSVFLLLLSRATSHGLSKHTTDLYLLSGTIIFSLFLSETILCVWGGTKTYTEKRKGYYESPYKALWRNHHRVWSPSVPHWLTTSEFSYIRPTNSLGFGDVEWPITKKRGEKRILTLGDSFTEGDGAPFDSSYVALMRTILMATDTSVYIMNAGVCGSDPFDNYVNYQDLLQRYKPDMIIQMIGSDDMNSNILIRGGSERFKVDGTTRYLPAPWWEPLYAISYISRLFFRAAKYNELLQKTTISLHEYNRIENSVEGLFTRYSALCAANNTSLIIVLHPEKSEVVFDRYNYDFQQLLNYLAKNDRIKTVDLLPAYRSYIKETHTKIESYYWQIDAHHNSNGYLMMAKEIADSILPVLEGPRQ